MDREKFAPLYVRFIICHCTTEYKLYLRREFVGMDSKQIKNLLKQAKEAIKNKDVTSALCLCKVNLEKLSQIMYVGL